MEPAPARPALGPGTLEWRPATPTDPALAAPVQEGLTALTALAELTALAALPALAAPPDGPRVPILIADIDPDLADTAAFCARYQVTMAESANCVIVAGRRGDLTRYAACLVLATTRADVNGLVRRRLDARKASFAPMADAVALSGMEFGGITPIGLPAGWPILVDAAVARAGIVVIGSGLRRSKLALDGADLLRLPGAELIDGLAST